MSIPLSIWHAQWRSLRNVSRHDTKMKIALGVMFVFSALLGFWWSTRLLEQIQQWQALGSMSVSLGMWSICMQTWLGMSFFTMLGTQRAISSDEAILLFTLPISQATRFRALFGSFFLENLWNWFLLQVVVMGYVLISTLGWQAIAWLVLLQVGIVMAVFCALLATLLFMGYVLPYGSSNTRVATILILLCLLLLG